MKSNGDVNRQVTRRKFLAATAAVGAAAVVRPWARAVTLPEKSDTRPNLILILADDQRADSLSCAGNPVLRTPNIDGLASKGVRFTNSFATTAVCMTSRASILTGLYARCHKINDFDTPLQPALFGNSYPILLRQAGYRTGFVGKWGLGGELPAHDYDYFTGYKLQGRYFEPGNPKHLTVRQGDQAVEFIRGCSPAQPFCLAVSFKAPHVQDEGRKEPGIYAKYPYDLAQKNLYANATVPPHGVVDVKPPPEFLNHTLNRLREGPDFSPGNYQETMKSLYRLISGIDIAVGRIVEALRQQGLEENTIIVYSADHGSLYGEHGFGGKWLMYEPSIRTPLIICDPRLPAHQRGTTRDQMVLNIDLPPTLLALAGVTSPMAMQGKNLLPLINRQPTSWRTEWFYEHLFRDGPISPNSPIAASEGIRTERWKYIRYIDRVPVYEQLFDLKNDPREENDLMGEKQSVSVLVDLRQRRENWLKGLKNWQPQNRWSEPWALTRPAI